MRLHRAQAGYLAAQGSGSKYIKFADQAVLDVLLAKGVSADGIGITTADVEKVTSIGTWFKGNTEITSFDEFEKFTGVTAVPWDSFTGCKGLTSIKLPKSVQTIGGRAFNYVSNLVFDIDLPNLEQIDKYSPFVSTGVRRMLDLGKITIMDTWYGANYNFVRDSSVLDLVIIPESVETINTRTFHDCPMLNTIVVKCDTPPTLSGVLRYGTTPSPTIYVKEEFVGSYQEATNWASYTIKPISSLQTDNPTLYNEIKDYL